MQFRTKARAVDLLGKGQIADLPTAITELWKNGYDAYADNLKADLYRAGHNELKKNCFIISDDGKGMSYSDILDKWLVLGTDSKSRAELEIESEDTLWKRPRIKAGEKGIGRLSVAYLGNPMLMVTKKSNFPIEILYFDWRLLENYNLFLDDITIPIKSVDNLLEIHTVFDSIKKDFLSNFDKDRDAEGNLIWEGKQLDLKLEIIQDTKDTEIEGTIYNTIRNFFTSNDSHGTMFLIFNPISQIVELSDIDDDKVEDGNFVTSSLTGFTNPFKEYAIKINTKFNIHNKSETFDLLQSRGEFFSHSDFELADVYINGEFDGNGNFLGKIRIYDTIIDYTYTNPRKKDKRSNYGRIPIELGYSQGESKSSNLSDIQYNKISSKVKEYGGLYIFRDDFRILPYGRENADFLNFELRRSKRAGTYYFSYRRMFGYLDLKRNRNPDLKDKSSREGLINNSQYRAFTSDAINFFIVLAQDYFATEAKTGLFRDKLKEFNEQDKALQADRAREKAEKIAFTKLLNSYPDRLEVYKVKYENLIETLETKLNNIHVTYYEVEEILDQLQKMDLERNDLIPKITKRYRPTETQIERLDKFENKLINFIELVTPKKDLLFKKAIDKLEIRDLKIDFIKKYNGYISSLEKLIYSQKNQLNDKLSFLITEYSERGKRILNTLVEDKEKNINKIISKEQVTRLTSEVEKRYFELLELSEKTIFPLVEHIKRLTFDIDEEQLQGAYKAQYDQMKYQWEQTRDTAQLGIAVEIIDHEFNNLYARINNQIDTLNSNEYIKITKEFILLKKNFNQLEDKYALLSPLYRSSGVLNRDVSCRSILSYIKEFFENQIEAYGIYLNATLEFENHIIKIKEPVIHTVFINIINNAIYWMRNSEKRVINLDYLVESNEILIANSGEKIPEYRLDKIFDLFYSQRPNGRGIGLYLAKQSLNESGLDIFSSNEKKYNKLNGACFVISQLK